MVLLNYLQHLGYATGVFILLVEFDLALIAFGRVPTNPLNGNSLSLRLCDEYILLPTVEGSKYRSYLKSFAYGLGQFHFWRHLKNLAALLS
ncbi:MAG: hypothetical protein A2051_12780 [Desulfovibrionales bacterium GWA2_65_9]|nr:MAG: hypothetical protein A2051_12780 [Desulfovibrionales bacterium GWA2_65_9]